MSEKILVIHLGALGDVILSFPALIALKQERLISLALLAHHQIGQLAQQLGVADDHFRAESARFSGLFARQLSPKTIAFAHQFDQIVIVSVSNDLEDRIRPYYSGKIYTISPRPPVEETVHVANHVTRQLVATGLLRHGQRTNRGLSDAVATQQSFKKIKPPVSDKACKGMKPTGGYGNGTGKEVNRVPNEPKKRLFVMHPGAGSVRKRWGLNNFLKLAEALKNKSGDHVVFLIGPAERDLLASLTQTAASKGIQVHQVDNLTKIADFIKGSQCFIGNDSGLSHLAGFLGIPTVTVFGPSSTQRWSPLGRAIKTVRGASDCLPCFEREKENCENPTCLQRVSVEMVFKAVGKLGVI